MKSTRMADSGQDIDTKPGENIDSVTASNIKNTPFEDWLDANFEPTFFKFRYVLLLPVLISFIGSIIMFLLGGYDTYKATYAFIIKGQTASESVVLPLVKALDAFLIGVILIIFSFGIYDFFISKLDPAEHAGIRPDWFKFESTGELKTKLIELVLVILAIQFFERMIANIDEFTEPIMYLIIPTGAAILAISLGFFKWATEE